MHNSLNCIGSALAQELLAVVGSAVCVCVCVCVCAGGLALCAKLTKSHVGLSKVCLLSVGPSIVQHRAPHCNARGFCLSRSARLALLALLYIPGRAVHSWHGCQHQCCLGHALA
jgi:hypothetical protein